MAPLQWQQVQAPGFADVSNILRNAAASWTEGFDTLNNAFADAHTAQSQTASNALLPQLAGITNEADIEPFLNDLPNMINSANITPELSQAISGLRDTALGYEQSRASRAQTNASTAGLIGGERRQQTSFDRGIANEDALAGLTNIFMEMGIQSFNQDGIAVDRNNQPIMNNRGQPLTEEEATQTAQAAYSQGAAGAAGSPAGNSSNTPSPRVEAYRNSIAAIESDGSGGYSAVGATHPTMGRALGRYQIMESNIPEWSRAALGRVVSADEFLNSSEIQDAIFDHRFQSYVDQYGEENAARAWFGGPGGIDNPGRTDVHGTLNIGEYGQRFMNGLGQGPSNDNGFRARIDTAAAGVPDNFDWSMGGVVRADQIQGLLNTTIDQATAGSNESRNARNDQQSYIDSLRQFNQDQITFQQSQTDRAEAEATQAEQEAGREAALAALRTASSMSEAQTMLTNNQDLSPQAVAAAQASLGALGSEAQFTPTVTPAGAPSMAAAETALNEFTERNQFELTANEATRINNRARDTIGDTDPAQYLLNTIDNLDMDQGKLRDMISNIARDNEISPAAAAVIMEENIERQGFWQLSDNLFRGKDWGKSYFNEEDANEMIQTAFSPEARRAASEMESTTEQRINSAQTAYNEMQDAQRRIALWAERNGGNWNNAPANLRNQYEQASQTLSQIVSNAGVASPDQEEVVGNVNGQQMTAEMISQLPPQQQQIITDSIAATEYIRNNPRIGSALMQPNITPEERQRVVAQLAMNINRDNSIPPQQKQSILNGLSQMAQGNTGLANN